MNHIIKKRSFGAWICTTCTLNCRNCVNYSNVYHKIGDHYFITFDDYKTNLDSAMQLIDEIDCFSITGGEPLLHPQLTQITQYTVEKYADRFNRYRITTNGTLLPSKDLLELLSTVHEWIEIEFLVDNYGELSRKAAECIGLVESMDIPVITKTYYGHDQYLDGWVSLGALEKERNYTEKQAFEQIQHCHYVSWGLSYMFKGKLYPCPCAGAACDMGWVKDTSKDCVDLSDDLQSFNKKRSIIAGWGKEALASCYYCDGFDPDTAVRYPAAEQES